VDDCRDDDGTTTRLIGDADGYLAVFPRHQTTSQRCPWHLAVNAGRRINITWRVSPTAVRYLPSRVSLPLGERSSLRVSEVPCSWKLTFTESGHDPVHWACRRQDTLPVDNSVQVSVSVPLLVLVPPVEQFIQLVAFRFFARGLRLEKTAI